VSKWEFLVRKHTYHLATLFFQYFNLQIKRPLLRQVRISNAPSGMPDGLFSNQKSQVREILGVNVMENAGIFYAYLVYFIAIGNILWPFGIFCGHLVFSPVLVCCAKKNLATLCSMQKPVQNLSVILDGNIF
jgi:hypothetical protein